MGLLEQAASIPKKYRDFKARREIRDYSPEKIARLTYPQTTQEGVRGVYEKIVTHPVVVEAAIQQKDGVRIILEKVKALPGEIRDSRDETKRRRAITRGDLVKIREDEARTRSLFQQTFANNVTADNLNYDPETGEIVANPEVFQAIPVVDPANPTREERAAMSAQRRRQAYLKQFSEQPNHVRRRVADLLQQRDDHAILAIEKPEQERPELPAEGVIVDDPDEEALQKRQEPQKALPARPSLPPRYIGGADTPQTITMTPKGFKTEPVGLKPKELKRGNREEPNP